MDITGWWTRKDIDNQYFLQKSPIVLPGSVQLFSFPKTIPKHSCRFFLSYQERENAQFVNVHKTFCSLLFQVGFCFVLPTGWTAQTRQSYLFSSSSSHFRVFNSRVWLSLLPALMGLFLLTSTGARPDQCKEIGQKTQADFSFICFTGIKSECKNLCSLSSHPSQKQGSLGQEGSNVIYSETKPEFPCTYSFYSNNRQVQPLKQHDLITELDSVSLYFLI